MNTTIVRTATIESDIAGARHGRAAVRRPAIGVPSDRAELCQERIPRRGGISVTTHPQPGDRAGVGASGPARVRTYNSHVSYVRGIPVDVYLERYGVARRGPVRSEASRVRTYNSHVSYVRGIPVDVYLERYGVARRSQAA